MNATGIEWCDRTWNVITGCRHGCPYCYARGVAENRLRGRHGYDTADPFAPAFHPMRLSEPLYDRRPRLIFPSSMGDALGAWVPRTQIQAVIDVCRSASWHRFLWLTKNPSRYAEFDWPANCWLGTSVSGEDTPANHDRLAALYASVNSAPGRHFISLEPFTLGDDAAPFLGTFLPAWVIIGAQTKPDVLPSGLALSRAVELLREAEVPFMLKDSLRPVWERIAPGRLMPRQWPEGLRLAHGKSAKCRAAVEHGSGGR